MKKPGSLVAALSSALAIFATSASAEPTIIELNQTPCQFIESENGVDHGYQSNNISDCEKINAQTGADRLAKSKVFELEPGEYIFRVTNVNVSYPLGFWLRGEGLLNRATLPSVSGGGLLTGVTKDYHISLEPGDYVYSCPLNPTPDYKIKVKQAS